MKWSHYVFLMTGLSLMLYLMGYTPVVNLFEDKADPLQLVKTNADDSINFDGTINPDEETDNNILMAALFIGVLSIIGISISFLTGFGATYVLPMVILMAVLNFFIFPINFLFTDATPDIIRIPAVVILNILLVLAVLDFTRGNA